MVISLKLVLIFVSDSIVNFFDVCVFMFDYFLFVLTTIVLLL